MKIYNLLKQDGIILVTLGTSGSEYGEEQDWCGAPMAWSTYEPEEYKKIMTDLGFKIQPTNNKYLVFTCISFKLKYLNLL